jgi:DNA replicative helicase MCM subunit Mcm2 (Cdc46/Mcm family)
MLYMYTAVAAVAASLNPLDIQTGAMPFMRVIFNPIAPYGHEHTVPRTLCPVPHNVSICSSCSFTDKQLIRLQETPDEIPAGETPYTLTLFAYDDLVDSVRPGDRVIVTGIYR